MDKDFIFKEAMNMYCALLTNLLHSSLTLPHETYNRKQLFSMCLEEVQSYYEGLALPEQ